MEVIRAFIAINIPEDIAQQIARVQEVLKGSGAFVKWVDPKNIHLTLKFLGNISEPQIADIIQAMRESTEGIPSFQISLSHVGAFPNLRYPRVIWVGVQDIQKALQKLQYRLEQSLRTLGFAAEEGIFKPHITLGRVKSQKNKSNLLRAVETLVNTELGIVQVNGIHLIRSTLKPTGPEYTILQTANLEVEG